MLAGWRRVPFTCTWLPGKRPLPLLMIAVIVSLLLLWLLGELMRLALTSLRGTLTLAGVLLGIAAALRWRRLRSWAGAPLQFEDELPNRVQTLGLHQR